MAHDKPLEQEGLNDVPETDFGKTLDALGDAFRDISEGTLDIPQESADDVREFLERLERAKIATRKHNIHFG